MSDETVYKAEEAGKLRQRESLPAYAIIGVGVVLLVANLLGYHLIDVLWPGFMIAPGLMLLYPTYASTPEKQSRLSFFAIPGAIMTSTGLLLFAMNLTNHFEAWAYSWTLVGAAVVGAMIYMKRFEPENRVHETGYQYIRFFFMAFMVLAVLFELVVFNNFNPLLPLALIGYGVYVLVKGRRETAAS
jgi:heme/copper-type cytochrome/quinol oxidase subunit 4